MQRKIPNWLYIVGGLLIVGAIAKLINPATTTPSTNPPDQSKATPTNPVPPQESVRLKCSDIEIARRSFKVEAVGSDLSQGFGTGDILSYLVQVKVTNNSAITLPLLTIMTETYDGKNSLITSSRAPSIDVHSVRPGDTVTVDHYAKGYIPGWNAQRVNVKVEDVISSDVREFFDELQNCV